MNDPVLLRDSTVLVADERDLTRRAQALVLETLADGRLMVTAALALAVARAASAVVLTYDPDRYTGTTSTWSTSARSTLRVAERNKDIPGT